MREDLTCGLSVAAFVWTQGESEKGIRTGSGSYVFKFIRIGVDRNYLEVFLAIKPILKGVQTMGSTK